MDQLADRLDRAADALASIDRRMPLLAVDAAVFAADESGAPGRLGRDLHSHWSAVLAARAEEASALAARLSDAAGKVRATARDYVATDEAARRRLTREV